MDFNQEMMDSKVVILDLETKVVRGKPSVDDEIKFVGFKSMSGTRVMFTMDQRDEIQQVLSYYQVYSGHNIEEYDIPILINHGFDVYIGKGKTLRVKKLLDTIKILLKRAKPMMYLDLSLGELGLGNLCKRFGLSSQKGDIDYDIFKQDSWTQEQLEEIQFYLYGDLDSSEALLEYLFNFFYGFKHYVSEKNQKNFSWLISSAGSTSYKIVCHNAGLKEEYTSGAKKSDEVQYSGGFVALPYLPRVQGKIHCVDWSSLYPHIFMSGNLYSPYTEEEINDIISGTNPNDVCWHGGKIFKPIEEDPDDGVKGFYKRDMGAIEKVIHKLYNDRIEHKKKAKIAGDEHGYESIEYKKWDAMQLATKIAINTIYGISGSEIFKNVYNLTTASDCTAMARTSIKHARKRLQDFGYIPLYTDSVTGDMTVNIRYNGNFHCMTFDELEQFILDEVDYMLDRSDKSRYIMSELIETLTMDDDRNIIWKPMVSFISHLTDKQCYKVDSKFGSVEVTEDHSLINMERITTRQGARQGLYKFSEVKPLDAEKMIVIQSMTDLPEREHEDESTIAKQMKAYGYYACKGSYINGKGMLFRKGTWSGPNKYLLNEVLKPLEHLNGGRVYKKGIGHMLGQGSWWIKQGKLFGLEQTIPEWFITLPVSYKLPLLNGIFTACGIARRKQVTFYLYNKEFKDMLKRFLLSLGLLPKLYIEKEDEYFILSTTVSMWFKYNVGSFDKNKHAHIYSKSSTQKRIQKKVTSVTPLEIKERKVYDIELDDFHRFFANDVCVHNTDSVYALDPFKDDNRLAKVCKMISVEQQQDMNIAIESHDFEIESDISHMYFFTNDKGKYVKKFYAYIYDKKGKMAVQLKGIPLVKGNTSRLAKSIYEEHIKQDLLDYKTGKYQPEEVFEWVKQAFLDDPDQLSKRFRPKELDEYKVPKGKEKPTSIHYAVAERYGVGEILLVPNTAIGPGKGKHYALKEELIKEFGDKWVDYVLLTPIVEELKVFIDWTDRKRIKPLQPKPDLKMFKDGDNIIETRNPITVRDYEKEKTAEPINRKTFLSLKKDGFDVLSIS